MNELIAVLLIVVLAVLVAILVIVLAARRKARQSHEQARRRAERQPADPFGSADVDAVHGDPRALTPGDIVDIRGVSYGVRGTLRFREGSWTWTEHLLDATSEPGAGGRRWLSVEEDPDLVLVLWQEVAGATVTPGPATLDFDGRSYTSEESGTADFTGQGTTGLDPSGVMRYHDYRAPDRARLSFEEYGGSGKWEVGRGEQLNRAEVRIYPAGDDATGSTGT